MAHSTDVSKRQVSKNLHSEGQHELQRVPRGALHATNSGPAGSDEQHLQDTQDCKDRELASDDVSPEPSPSQRFPGFPVLNAIPGSNTFVTPAQTTLFRSLWKQLLLILASPSLDSTSSCKPTHSSKFLHGAENPYD